MPPEQADAIAGELTPENSTDAERDEFSDEEIHDVALAVEKSSYSAHGHEVTSPPSDADQGETIRIVTEAVEQNEPGAQARIATSSGTRTGRAPASFQPAIDLPLDTAIRKGRRSGRRRILIQMINPNHREDTQVAAGLGNRGRSREELPLSTRVHELAKELGLKSQELLRAHSEVGARRQGQPVGQS